MITVPAGAQIWIAAGVTDLRGGFSGLSDKSGKKATPAKGAPKGKKAAKRAKPQSGARAGSKTEKVLELLKRSGGATLKQIMKATGWQPHSVRGFICGTLGKKMGLKIESAKSAEGGRIYTLAK